MITSLLDIRGSEEDWPEKDRLKRDELWHAVQKHAKNGVAKKSDVAKEMRTTTRSLNRMFECGPMLIQRNGQPTVTLTGDRGVICITRIEPNADGSSTESGPPSVPDPGFKLR